MRHTVDLDPFDDARRLGVGALLPVGEIEVGVVLAAVQVLGVVLRHLLQVFLARPVISTVATLVTI